MIAGIDEVGRGCWAGPLVAGVVVLDTPIKGLRDSKKLTARQRERLDGEIRVSGAGFGLGWVTAPELDEIGLTEAVRLAMQRALQDLDCAYDRIIVDGSYNFLADNPLAEAIVKADDTEPAVSAASIIAKVARDRYMTEAARRFPGYGFDSHVGYGTRNHIAALRELGICELHRLSFRPVAALLA